MQMYNCKSIFGNPNKHFMKSLPFLFSILLFTPCLSFAQGLLTSRIINSGLIIDAEYHPGDLLYDNDLNFLRSRIGVSVPVKSKFSIKPDFKKFALEDLVVITDWKRKALPLIQKYFQPKMHQIVWNLNINYAHFQDDFYFQNMAGFSTGITGFHYLKKAKFGFYSGTIGLNENPEYYSKLDVQGAALAGMAILSGVRSVFYFGGFVGYANNQVFPAPFIGFDTKVAKRLRLNVTLPVQMKLTYKKKKHKLSAFFGLSGFASGYEPVRVDTISTEYYNVGYLDAVYFKSGLSYSFSLGKRSRLNLFAGYLPWRNFRFGFPKGLSVTPNLKATPYWGFSFNKKLGKSLFDASIGNMLN